MEAREGAAAALGSEAGAGVVVKESSSPTPSSTPSPKATTGAAAAGVAAAPPLSGEVGIAMGIGAAIGISDEDLTHKKRGGPRNYGPDDVITGGMALALSPATPADFSGGKRGRGRPPGSGRRQLLATLGEWFAFSAGGNFTPHVITVATGEDVAARIFSFSHKGPRSICVLSANGAISNVTLRQPGSSGGTLTYEGRFEILSLSGSFTIAENGGVRSRTGGISVSLAGPDGRVVGGGVAGSLLAASPIQVVVGSFLPNVLKEHKRKADLEPSTYHAIPSVSPVLTAARPISQATRDDSCETRNPLPFMAAVTEITTSSPNPNPVPFMAAGWQSKSSEHKPSPDINICLPGE